MGIETCQFLCLVDLPGSQDFERPEMGGKKWYDQYDALLRKIQKQLGVNEEDQGLKAAERNWAALESSPKK